MIADQPRHMLWVRYFLVNKELKMYYINLQNVQRQEFYKTPEQQAILPETAIELTDEKFNDLWAADQAGKVIVLENNELVIKDHTDLMNLDEIKAYAIGLTPLPIVSEVTLANGLIFDDSEKSMAYLQTKRNTSNSQETVYDKYNTSATMSNSELTAAVSVIATSQMSKDDEYKAKVVEISNASSIDEVKDLAGMYKEKTVKLIVDVDVDHFDNTNQVTNEELNQVVLGDPGDLDLSDISWINGVGVKSINGQTESVEVIDSNGVSTALLVFSPDSPVINGSLTADGLPVELELVVYCRNAVSGGSHMTQA